MCVYRRGEEELGRVSTDVRMRFSVTIPKSIDEVES
jgi:hypothetical protein